MRLSAPTAGASGLAASAGIAGAQCGTPYSANVQLACGMQIISVQIDPSFGLLADSLKPGRLHGTPTRTGAAQLRIQARDRAGHIHALSAQLQISANPRSLWKDLASDPKARFAKAPLAQAKLAGPHGLELLAVSCRGRMHANTGAFRDDDFAIGLIGDQQFVLIAADGAGSAPLAREGARLAVQAALAALGGVAVASEVAQVAALKSASRAALAEIERCARALNEPVAAFNTTLLIALGNSQPPHTLSALQIGDGLIAALPKLGAWSAPLCVADQGEFHGQTHFLSAITVSDESLATRIRTHHFAQLQRVLVATDGIVDPYFETESALLAPLQWQPFTRRLDDALDAANSLEALQHWLADFTPGHHDDRTIALAVWP